MPAGYSGSVAEAAPMADAEVRTAILYSSDASGAQAFADLLNGNGHGAQTFQVEGPDVATPTPTPSPTAAHMLNLPYVRNGNGGGMAAAGLQAVPDFSNFDLILVMSDTGAEDKWSNESGLVDAIKNSGLPVVGIGRGGHILFGLLGLAIGHPNTVAINGNSIQVADFGDSQPLYTMPNGVTIPENQIIQILKSEKTGVAVPLQERLPEGIRFASVPGQSSQYPIVQEAGRFLLWGFETSAGDLTGDGVKLFLNSLRFQTQELTIPLQNRTFTPSAGIEQALLDAIAAAGEAGVHALVQLNRLPTAEEVKMLAEAGLNLINFIDGTTYAAHFSPNFDSKNATVQQLVRWAGLYVPADKVDPKILAGDFEEWAENKDGTVNLFVLFFDDTSEATEKTVLEKYAQSAERYTDHKWAVVMEKAQIVPLSGEDSVRWIEEGPAPALPTNDVARDELFVDEVQNATVSAGSIFYAGLDGTGVNVGVWDTGVANHADFAGRLLRTQAEVDPGGHGTHVAGIIGASGAQSVANCPSGTCTDFQMRGMAPNVGLIPYRSGWSASEMEEGINDFSMDISNHSYVMTCGDYSTAARDVDRLLRGQLSSGGNSIPPHIAFFAAANQGTAAQWCRQDSTDSSTGPRGYFSVLSPAKNQTTVGAINPASGYDLRSSSSRGPTWDGRLKPDVMAHGCEVSTDNNPANNYQNKCGTSMASPATAGVAALLTEQYHKAFPGQGNPNNATVKAVLVQTASDLEHQPGQAGFAEYGWNDPDTGQPVIYHAGPDWSTGYGVIHAQRAVSAMRAGNFVEDTVSPGSTTDNYTFNVSGGRTELKFTLVWDDEPGDPTKAISATQLVNDLDLLVIDPDGIQFRPWVLPALPMNGDPTTGNADPIVRNTHILPAVRGVDRLNNVEQVSITNAAGLKTGNWTIRVTANALPNNNPQDYTLAGDFRKLNIVEPQTGNVAEAGDPNNPNVVLVVVEAVNGLTGASGPSNLQDASPGDFTVQINGTGATIISGLPVGDQYWLNVRPASGVYAGGSKYDLKVSWTGFGDDTESRAILFTEREVTDRSIVMDYSGSMSNFDKMAAAQNAARLFIDQSLIGDRIAVVGFSTNAITPYPLAEVSADPAQPELNAAKAAVNALTPDDLTAIGKGLLAGKTEVEKAPADFSLVDVLILLSDGMENVDPDYDTPAVKGVIEPTDIIVHTVAVGPASAGHHSLLDTIAGDNGGSAYQVTEAGTTMSAASTTATAALTGVDAWPNTLPNRLGDTYKAIAEDILKETRLFQATGIADPKVGTERWEIQVPDGLSRITFAVNWSEKGHLLILQVQDPDGNVYMYDQKNPNCRNDETHQTCIIDQKVIPGTWLLSVHFEKSSTKNEYVVWASAHHPVSFQLFVGTPQQERVVHNPIQLIGFLMQGEKSLAGQKVEVRIFGPQDTNEKTDPKDPQGLNAAATSAMTIELFDDGMHGDGAKDDGIYGAVFTGGNLPGPYTVRGRAMGKDINGEPFELFRSTTFNLMPRALYVYDNDRSKARNIEDLLEQNGIGVDLVRVGEVPSVNLNEYSLVIIGADTGNGDRWGTREAFNHIIQNERRVMGMGEGGYAYFGLFNLNIGYPNGAHSKGTSIFRNLFGDSIWTYPYEFGISRSETEIKLYMEDSNRVDIFLEKQPKNVQIFGYNNNDTRYGDIVYESEYWMLWGFDDGPKNMTPEGKDLFVNTVHRSLK